MVLIPAGQMASTRGVHLDSISDEIYHKDPAQILGMTEGQVRYAHAKGRIPKGHGVDAWGRPFWTEEEVDGLVGRVNDGSL